jgi:KUP system potassium uptake protein
VSSADDERQARDRRALHEAAHKLAREPPHPGPRAAPRTPLDSRRRPPSDGEAERPALRPWEQLPGTEDEPAPAPDADAARAAEERDVIVHAGRAVLALGALGVVYGDIGTSPLYTLQVTLGYRAASQVDPTSIYGVISLIFWTITAVVSVKYAGFIMRAHNRGDGGIMALAAIARRRKVPHMVLLVTLGIFGASLFFGDGVITPAISVLSAVAGLTVPAPGLRHLVVPISIAILLGLFVFQRKGTGAVGGLFGPVMLVWFGVLAVLGGHEILRHPDVLQAFSPVWGVRFFTHHGVSAFLALGGIVLAVTGAEALYADRGHFGPAPIRLAWFGIVLPGVLLSYLGQAALVLHHHADKTNPFFLLAPSWAQIPLVILATMATIIASQAVISGSYSVARQAMQLGFLPRLRIVHTSELEGQIYVPIINWILAVGVVALVLAFQNSNALSNAYGVAVTGTFILNTILFLAVSRALWRTSLLKLALLGTLFLTVEVAFFAANLVKILDGAWFPLAAGATVSLVMLTWNRGRAIVTANRAAREGPLREFLDGLRDCDPPVHRVPGTAIFLNPGRDTTPLALRAAIEHTHSLHEKVLLVSVEEVSFPHVDDEHRFVIQRLGPEEFSLRHVGIRIGYQEQPDVPRALRLARRELLLERDLDLEHASYFISRITIVPDEHSPLRGWQQKLFVGIARNAASPIDHFKLPEDRTVSIGASVGA